MRLKLMIQLRAVLLFAAFTPMLMAQTNTPPAEAGTSIKLDVVVTQKSGPPVTGLAQQDFTILDNNVPRPILSFQAFEGPESPVRVILVEDAVNAPYDNIAYQRGQIERFLHANGGQLPHPTALAFFTDNGIELQKPFSTDGNELSGTFDHYAIGLRSVHRSSQFQAIDRFNLSLRALGSLLSEISKLPGRKMVLWVSPGWPLLSNPGVYLDEKQQKQIFASVIRINDQLLQSQVTLYSINPIGAAEGVERSFYYKEFLKGAAKPGDAQLADLSLQVLAVQSGGLALNANNDITGQLQQCMEDGRAYYELSFAPPPAETATQYHALQVRVNKPGLAARTRSGYYTGGAR